MAGNAKRQSLGARRPSIEVPDTQPEVSPQASRGSRGSLKWGQLYSPITERRSTVAQTLAHLSAQGHATPSLARGLEEVAIEEEEPPFHISGFLLDFLHRHGSQPEPRPGHGGVPTAEDYLEDHKHPGWVGYHQAVDIINLELLVCAIKQDVTLFWKNEEHTHWGFCPHAFWESIHKIIKWKREAVGLRQEVEAFHFRHLLLGARPRSFESPRGRHGRTQKFWADFHEGSRRIEPRAIGPPFKEDLRKRVYRDNLQELPPQPRDLANDGDSPQPLVKKSGRNITQRLKKDGGRVRGGSLLQDLDWKHRSTRSKVSAGTWDWSHGAPSLSRCGTPATNRAVPAHWSTTLFDLADEELEEFNELVEEDSDDDDSEEEEEEAETFLTQPSRPSSSQGRLNKPTLARPLSLPNLKRLTEAFGPEVTRPGTSQSAISSVSDNSTLPPVNRVFSVPWQGKSSEPVLKCSESTTKRYLRACQKDKRVPAPLPFITGDSLKWNANFQALSDKDLLAVTVTLEDLGIEEVDLEGNTQLTERSLVKFAQTLSKNPAASTLRLLSLKRVSQAGQKVLSTIVKMIADPSGAQHLQHLDLTDVHIGTRCHLPFARAVRDHHALKQLHLVNTGLGAGADIKQFTYDLLGSTTVEILDLGWNCFTPEDFDHLGERHCEMQKLKRLGLSNCIAAPKLGRASPISHFMEHLARDSSLRSLDVSLNRIDFRGVLVLEDALTNHKHLNTLDICHNPLGVFGIRSLFRLLCKDSSGLLYFECRDCSSGMAKEVQATHQVFQATTPGGRYTLELDRPYHRALLRMLYKTSEHFNIIPGESFTNVVYTAGAWTHAQKDSYGVWVVPTRGKLTCTFSIDKALQQEMEGSDHYDFDSYITRHFKLMRTTPGFRKIVPLLGQWKAIEGRLQEQMTFLDALAKDFQLKYPQIRQMCASKSIIAEVISRLLNNVEGGVGARYLTMMLITNVPEYVRVTKRVDCFLNFNVQNPNGRYRLDLSNHMEHAVAEQLLLLDRWETGVNMRQNRIDTSQRGNYSVIRNEKHGHRWLADQVRSMTEWNMPEHDVLEFDYSSNQRPSVDAKPLDEISMSNIMLTLSRTECKSFDEVTALRLASHELYLTSVQLRSIFGSFAEMEVHGDLLCIFFVRVVDMHNEKVFRVRFEDEAFLFGMRSRLGYVNLFPFIQPEQAKFVLDFGAHDQKIVANILMNLAKQEHPYNLRNPTFIRADGTTDPLTQGIPQTWVDLAKMPLGGIFKITYVGAPDNRNFEARKKHFESYGGWRGAAKENEVMWWASLKEAPPDCLEFLEFLIAHYDSIEDAFSAIDGGGGNGVISLREFEVAYQEMGCKKFQGNDEKKRIEGVFRWLEPSGDGQVTRDEFMILDQLFSEIQLSIREFVEFCERSFGDDLADTWTYLDGDGSGEIDKEEWLTACKEIGYRGPVDPIFNYLDKDDEGHVSLDEFQELNKFKKERSQMS